MSSCEQMLRCGEKGVGKVKGLVNSKRASVAEGGRQQRREGEPEQRISCWRKLVLFESSDAVHAILSILFSILILVS